MLAALQPCITDLCRNTGRTNYRRTLQDSTGHRKTPQDNCRTAQDTTGHSADVDAVSWLTSYGS